MGCGTRNIWTKWISWFTIVFGVGYVVIEILMLVLYDNPDVNANYFNEIVFYFAYLELQNDLTEIKILLYCSIVLNFLWILTSIILLIYLNKTENGDYSMKQTQKLIKIYILWIVIAFICFIPDDVAAVMHCINLVDYYSNHNEEISQSPIWKTVFHTLKQGSTNSFVISLRFGLFYLIQICSWVGMIVIVFKLHKSVIGEDNRPAGRIVPLKPPKPALKPTKVPQLEETNVDRVRDWYKHYEGNDRNVGNNQNYYSEPNVPSYLPRVNGNTNPAFMSNVLPPVTPPKPSQHHMPGSNTNVMVNGVTSGTLRRQLPWSYMPSGGGVPHLPPKRLSPASSNASTFANSAPYVPAPDYNNKPNSTKRQELNQPGWNQYL